VKVVDTIGRNFLLSWSWVVDFDDSGAIPAEVVPVEFGKEEEVVR
jgi:hypothetical protein